MRRLQWYKCGAAYIIPYIFYYGEEPETLHLSFVNAYKQGIWRGEEFLFTLHPLFTTLHRYVVRSLPALPFLHRKGNKNIQYNRCIE